MFLEIGSLYYERISFPSSYRVAVQKSLSGRRVFTAVQVNRALRLHPIHLHNHAVGLNGDGIGNGIEHHRWGAYWNTVLLSRCFGITVGGHGSLAFFGDGPVSRSAKKAVEFGARREPGPCNAGGRFIAVGRVNTPRRDIQRNITAVLLVEMFPEYRYSGVVPAGVAATGYNIACRKRVLFKILTD